MESCLGFVWIKSARQEKEDLSRLSIDRKKLLLMMLRRKERKKKKKFSAIYSIFKRLNRRVRYDSGLCVMSIDIIIAANNACVVVPANNVPPDEMR